MGFLISSRKELGGKDVSWKILLFFKMRTNHLIGESCPGIGELMKSPRYPCRTSPCAGGQSLGLVFLDGLYCSITITGRGGAVAGIFAEVIFCWVKPPNASIPVWDTSGILNTATGSENYTRKTRSCFG